MADRKRTKITLSIDDLNAALDSFEVEPPKAGLRGRVAGAEDTEAGVTCNFKCGETQYWECATTPYDTCPAESAATNCFSCYPDCVTNCAAGDPFSWMC